jgi:GlpG protein
MQFIKIAEFTPETDTSPVTQALQNNDIIFKLVEENGMQVLWVDANAHVGDVVSIVRAAAEDIEHRMEATGVRPAPNLGLQFHRTPVMMIALMLSIAGALLVSFQFPLLHWFTFQDFRLISSTEIEFSPLAESLALGQYWRLFTPMFIHFGVFHIAFNGLWLWEFGRRIETLTGSFHFLMLMLVIGLISNYCQYLWDGPSLFGGMSGVLYGLLGYIWIRNLIAPSPSLRLPKGIIGFMLIWLAVCMSGAITFLFGAGIANAAHVSGLLAGMALGAVFGMVNRSAI